MQLGRRTTPLLTASAGLTLIATLTVAAQRLPGLSEGIQEVRQEGVIRLGAFSVAAPWAVAAPPAQPYVATRGPDWSTTDSAIAKLQEQLNSRPEDAYSAAGYAQLGNLYLQKARETGDPAWYVSAEGALQKSFALAPDNILATYGTGHLQLARHAFAEALESGRKVVELAPNNYAGYGIIGDALIELGRYEEAVEAIQQMVDLRPDLTSLSRVSYARELHGDLAGAIEAMRQAANAGAPRAEGTNWARVQHGHLYFLTGDLENAERQYRMALVALPNYVHGLAGLARVEAARGNVKEAIALYTRAQEIVPLPEYATAMGDLYRASGNAAAAARQEQLVRVIAQLQRSGGMDVDLDMALFEVDHATDAKAIESALQSARAQYERRPESIHANDVLAWALYRAGRPQEALPFARAALRLGTKDPVMLYHAGAIAAAAGERAEAKNYLEESLASNPNFHVRFALEAKRLLEQVRMAGA